jgi:G3E family GTPase
MQAEQTTVAPLLPVIVLTGFLGSGKTTLLRALLRDPALSRTAVIVNEFGEIGIDHDLIEASDESLIELTTGCLCCKVRSDLVLTLRDLAQRRAAGTVVPFERVVIETSGLADPAAIVQALMADRDLALGYRLGHVVCTVDGALGMSTLDQHAQSLRQAAMADRLVLTKSDRADAHIAALGARLAALNPGAQLLVAAHGALAAGDLLDARPYDADALGAGVRAWLDAEDGTKAEASPAETATGVSWRHAAVHDPQIGTWSLTRTAPLRAATLALFIEALTEHAGASLLRMKGIVCVAEDPEHPAVLHGVQHVFEPPQWLPRWPSADRRTRLVFIGRAIPIDWIDALLDALEAEVAEVAPMPQAQAAP